MSAIQKRPVRLATSISGVNHWTLWGHPDARSQIEIETFLEQIRTAERGLFDFFFLTEGLRLREYFGKIHDLDVVGRPDNLTMLAALAGVTEHIGLIATVSATFNEPYDLARRLSTLDHLSGGRAGWNIVTSSDAFTGANFRRGGYLDHSERYSHAHEFLDFAKTLWDAGAAEHGGEAGGYAFSGTHHSGVGAFTLSASPQRYPVFMQAGDSDEGRDFAIEVADLVFTMKPEHPEGTEFRADLDRRARAAGRNPESVLVFAKAEVVLADTDAEARELQREVSYQQISPATARNFLGLAWGKELSDIDVDAPPPAPEAPATDATASSGAASQRYQRARDWYDEARDNSWSVRDLIVRKHTQQTFVGTAQTVAAKLDEAVQNRVADGFLVGTPAVPTGLTAFVDTVVPLLQERGVYRTEYDGGTLRDNLGLGASPRT